MLTAIWLGGGGKAVLNPNAVQFSCDSLRGGSQISKETPPMEGLGTLFDALNVLSQPLVLIGHSLQREHVLDSFH